MAEAMVGVKHRVRMGRCARGIAQHDRRLRRHRSPVDIQRARVDGRQVDGDPHEQQRGGSAEDGSAWHGSSDMNGPGNQSATDRTLNPRTPFAPSLSYFFAAGMIAS